MTASEKETLTTILEEDLYALMGVKDSVDGFVTVFREEGDSGRWTQWITVVTKAPSGDHYMWQYGQGLTEYQENEDWDGELTLVEPVERTVVVVDWVKK